MSTLSTHVLETSSGRPAEGIAITLEVEDAKGWRELARGVTNADGRVKDFLSGANATLSEATYRLTFDTGSFYRARSTKAFYPSVQITFVIAAPAEHYHVPLLLSPFGFSTYRGS